ncbi:MAG: transglutaminase-like domain-containing protein, partial [Ruminococcus sp.]|nr:transglutaminase-like domain-containing protein [Ruminococcus sp.]
YKRSDEINQKRIEIRDAVNSFSVEDLAGSISEITSVFGFTFKVEGQKLGNIDQLKYKETTDLIVTLDQKYEGAIYLKEYTGSIYGDNEWLPLSDSAYKNDIFEDFEKYSTYPQDFPYRFNCLLDFTQPQYTIWINSKLRKNKSFAPYGTDNIGILKYNRDENVSSKSSDEYSYKFTKVDPETIAQNLDLYGHNSYSYFIDGMVGEEWRSILEDYCNEKDLLSDDGIFYVNTELPMSYDANDNLTKLIQSDYQDFVYENYLQVPNNQDITEVRNAFSEILSQPSETAEEKIQLLTDIRDHISSMAEYSLNPGKTPNSRDFVNYFLLENHKGYCTHYATSGVLLSRMAGIPARYATGYVLVGNDFNEGNKKTDGSYTITLKDNRRHAWVEVYLNGYGWIPFEFTAGYSNQTIDTTPTTTTATTISPTTETTSVVSSSAEDETSTQTHNQSTRKTASSIIQNTATTTATEIVTV